MPCRDSMQKRFSFKRTSASAVPAKSSPKWTYLCSGTLLKRMMKCGKASCGCQTDPAARHGPYYEWGHMKDGKLVHRYVSPEQAQVLHQAIANHRNVKKLLRTWETETERVLDTQYPHNR